MKKILKKNQIIITALAIMIAVAGYLNYTGTKLEGEDDTTKTSTTVSEEDLVVVGDITTKEHEVVDATKEEVNTADISEEDIFVDTEAGVEDAIVVADGEAPEVPGEAVLVGNEVTSLNFIAEARLTREQVRAKNKEVLMEVINNTNVSEQQKQSAIDGMLALTDATEKESAAELLLEAKGFEDVVVNITGEEVDVVVNMEAVDDAKRAQIEDIVKRKTGAAADKIVISPIRATK